MLKIMVEWRAKPGKEQALEGMVRDLRTKAMQQPGYISGETLVKVDDPSTYMVVSQWTRLQAWKSWEHSQARQEIVQLIAPNVSEESCIQAYNYVFEEE